MRAFIFTLLQVHASIVTVSHMSLPFDSQVPQPDGFTITAVTPAPLSFVSTTLAPPAASQVSVAPMVPITVDPVQPMVRAFDFRFCNPLAPEDCATLTPEELGVR